MSKRRWASLVLLLLLVVGLAWFFYVPSYDADAVKDWRTATEARLLARDQLPADANGYPDLAAILAHGADRQSYIALDPYWDYNHSVTMTHLKEVKLKADRATFEKVLPTIARAFDKPHFSWPSHPELGTEAPAPDLLTLRMMAISVEVEGELAEQQGQLADAAQDYLRLVRLGTHLRQGGSLIACMMGVGITHIGLEPLNRLLASDDLDAAQCKAIGASLDHMGAPDSDFVDAMDEEYVLEDRTMEILGDNGGEPTGPNHRPVFLTRLLAGRERRVHNWLYWRYRASQAQLKVPADAGLDVPADTHWLKVHLSLLNLMIMPNETRAVAQFAALQTALRGVRLVAALEAWHKDKGDWPPTLQSLVPTYLPAVPADVMAADGAFTYAREGTLTSVAPNYHSLLNHPHGQVQFLPFREDDN